MFPEWIQQPKLTVPEWIKQNKRVIIASGSIGVILLAVMMVTIKANNWANWTGFGGKESISKTITKKDSSGNVLSIETTTETIIREPGKTLWDWLSLLGVPLSLAILGFWLQRQQQKRTEAASKEQRDIAANEAKEEVLQVYFDRLSTLLIDKNLLAIAIKIYPQEEEREFTLQEKEKLAKARIERLANIDQAGKITPAEQELFDAAVDVIRARTLSILRRFNEDTERKPSIIRFLIEAEVISQAKLSLAKADLSKTNLRGANLRGN